MNRVPWVVTIIALCVTAAVLILRASAPAAQGTAWQPLAEPATLVPGSDNVASAYHIRIKSLEQRLQTQPDDTASLLELAGLLQDGHRPAEAAERLVAYLALAPTNRRAWLDLAASYGAAEDWLAARTAMTAFLERFPDEPTALFNMGAIEANLANISEARSWFGRAAGQQADSEIAASARSALGRLGG